MSPTGFVGTTHPSQGIDSIARIPIDGSEGSSDDALVVCCLDFDGSQMLMYIFEIMEGMILFDMYVLMMMLDMLIFFMMILLLSYIFLF